jgi:hypothetical protein
MTLPEDNFGDETKGDDEIHYNNMDMNMSERHGLASLHFTSLHFMAWPLGRRLFFY